MPTQAQKFRELARAMQQDIDDKNRPRLENTRRRAAMAASIRDDARKLERVQSKLYALADAHEENRVPLLLRGITSKALVEDMVRCEVYYTHLSGRLKSAGIAPEDYLDARAALMALGDQSAGQVTAADKIRDLERDLIGQKIPGFFPTPPEIVEIMLVAADIGPGDRVLEPSAGTGNIAVGIIQRHPTARLDVIEIRTRLREILRLKGFTPLETCENDFLQLESGNYDVIVMNPPFESFQDIRHVLHAFRNLRPGGRLVAVMSESGFFRQDKTAQLFRGWLAEHGGMSLDLPAGAFAASGTGVKTRIILVDKPAASKSVEVALPEPASVEQSVGEMDETAPVVEPEAAPIDLPAEPEAAPVNLNDLPPEPSPDEVQRDILPEDCQIQYGFPELRAWGVHDRMKRPKQTKMF
jgi:hypothetical protein